MKLFGSTSWELTWNGYWLPKIMGYDSSSKSYKEFDDEEDGVIRMPECDEFGILFNLYDSFVSGQSRVVMVRLPSTGMVRGSCLVLIKMLLMKI